MKLPLANIVVYDDRAFRVRCADRGIIVGIGGNCGAAMVIGEYDGAAVIVALMMNSMILAASSPVAATHWWRRFVGGGDVLVVAGQWW